MADEDEYRLIVDGIQCPPEYTHILTPLEFEELVLAFREHDPERTGLIPLEPFKDVCRGLDYTLSKDVVEKMFEEVDGDGGIEVDEDGLVDMDELCRIAVMAKTCEQGKVMHISEKLLKLRTTPFVELHREAGTRNLRVKFACLDIRDTSDVGLAVHVSEVRLAFNISSMLLFPTPTHSHPTTFPHPFSPAHHHRTVGGDCGRARGEELESEAVPRHRSHIPTGQVRRCGRRLADAQQGRAAGRRVRRRGDPCGVGGVDGR